MFYHAKTKCCGKYFKTMLNVNNSINPIAFIEFHVRRESSLRKNHANT